MTFEVTRDSDGAALVTIAGELDLNNIRTVEAAVDKVIRSKPDRLVIDIGGLGFADSSAIAMWVRWANLVPRVEIRDPSPLLRTVITRMGLSTRLRMSP